MWRYAALMVLASALLATSLNAQSAPVPDNEWQRWLKDVEPLMVGNEAKQAEKVAAADREAFREAFWQRRSPAREELQARITSADKEYRSGRKQAWNDCGRAFLLLGKPDWTRSVTAKQHFESGDSLAAMRNQDEGAGMIWMYKDHPRLPKLASGYSLTFTNTCECLAGPGFNRMLQALAASYVAEK